MYRFASVPLRWNGRHTKQLIQRTDFRQYEALRLSQLSLASMTLPSTTRVESQTSGDSKLKVPASLAAAQTPQEDTATYDLATASPRARNCTR